MIAASYWSGPSMARSGRSWRASSVARFTFSTSSPAPLAPVEWESIATRGRIPNADAESALWMAMSASCSAVGAPPPPARRRRGRPPGRAPPPARAASDHRRRRGVAPPRRGRAEAAARGRLWLGCGARGAAHELGGVERDHELLVGGHHRRERPLLAGDAPALGAAVAHVGDWVHGEAEEAELLQDARADGGRVLADAAGEDERVQPAERHHQARHRLGERIAEDVDGELGPIVAGVG